MYDHKFAAISSITDNVRKEIAAEIKNLQPHVALEIVMKHVIIRYVDLVNQPGTLETTETKGNKNGEKRK